MLKRLTVLRHSTAMKAADDSYEADLARGLTDAGVSKARRRREVLGNPEYDLVLSSSALRAAHTAALVAGYTKQTAHRVMGMPCFCYADPTQGGEAETINHLFKMFGHGPLRQYSEANGYEAIQNLGTKQWEVVTMAGQDAPSILVVTHDILLSELGLQAVKGNQSFEDQLLDADFKETGGFITNFEDGTAVDIDVFDD